MTAMFRTKDFYFYKVGEEKTVCLPLESDKYNQYIKTKLVQINDFIFSRRLYDVQVFRCCGKKTTYRQATFSPLFPYTEDFVIQHEDFVVLSRKKNR